MERVGRSFLNLSSRFRGWTRRGWLSTSTGFRPERPGRLFSLSYMLISWRRLVSCYLWQSTSPASSQVRIPTSPIVTTSFFFGGIYVPSVNFLYVEFLETNWVPLVYGGVPLPLHPRFKSWPVSYVPNHAFFVLPRPFPRQCCIFCAWYHTIGRVGVCVLTTGRVTSCSECLVQIHR
jgi:hypothetical protein